MAETLTVKLINELTPPETGNRIVYDDKIKGLGVRITAAGHRAFVFNYRIRGRERRITIGKFESGTDKLGWARRQAKKLRRMVEEGKDPLEQRTSELKAPTVADLCNRFAKEHFPKLRARSAIEYQAVLVNHIKPAWGNRKVADITDDDVTALHRKITALDHPYMANRVLAVTSKMFAVAVRWKMRPDNPAKGIERNHEAKRRRYLKPDELARLNTALDEFDDRQAADVFRILMYTGARRGEVLAARWDQLDFETGVWTKEAAATKQKAEHIVPLSAPALLLLSRLQTNGEFVFPGRSGGHRVNVGRPWVKLCRAAGIENLRIHDLRHSFASVLVSSGLSLPVVGALLGHSQPQTTARYAHLMDDALRRATETAGAVMSGAEGAEVVKLRKGT